MNTSSAMPVIREEAARSGGAGWRAFAWCVRKELWEHRSLVIAPLTVAGVVAFATLIDTFRKIAAKLQGGENVEAAAIAAKRAFSMAPAPIMLAALLVGAFYCLDALYGERRDRSILFWKSLPVSDRTTVFSKALVPLFVLPLIALLLSIAVQAMLLLAATAAVVGHGRSPLAVWQHFELVYGIPIMAYGLTVHALWYAPIYGWLLLVSAWARRAPLLWAVLPLFAFGIFERIVFDSSHFLAMVKFRLGGALKLAFDFGRSGDVERYAQLLPAQFLSAPGLWIGVIFAGGFLFAAARLRRKREASS